MPHVYVIGDSISQHYGPFLADYLRGVCTYARKSAEDLAALGTAAEGSVNGGDSRAVREFLSAMLAAGRLRADLLVLNCGLHDIRTDAATGRIQVPIEEYRQNLEAMLGMVAEVRVETAWIRTTPCDEAVHNARPDMSFHRFSKDCDDYNEAADAIMRSKGIPEIDLYGFTRNLGPDLYSDHVHFPEHIRQKQAAFIAGWVYRWAAARLE